MTIILIKKAFENWAVVKIFAVEFKFSKILIFS